jgi:ABC-type bacteriocin/lantibiotic exporter with double-glycine peptidase domain
VRHQRLTYWCGPASIANALECIGIKRDQEQIAKLCHVTRDGTPEEEIIRAVLACKARVSPWSNRGQRASLAWLHDQLTNHGPAILAVDHDQHWVTAVGALGPRSFWLFDPATGAGFQLLDRAQMVKRWRLGEHRKGPWYYGIGVSL